MKQEESVSRWLMRWVSEVRGSYITASFFTLLSAACFVFFSWYIAGFSNSWLISQEMLSDKLLFALAFLAGRYVFAHIASLLNYRAGNNIVANIKQKLYPALLRHNQTDSVTGTLMVTRVSDDLKPFFSFFVPYAIASLLVGLLLLGVSFYFEFWVGLTLLAALIVIPLLMMIIGVGATSLHNKHIQLFVRYSAVFHNRLQTIAEIVNLDNFDAQYAFLEKKSKTLNEATTNVMRVAILSSAVLELFVSIAIAGAAIFLGMSLLGLIPGDNYGQGYDYHVALFLLILAPYFFFYLRKFVSAYHDRNKAVASANLLRPFLVKEVEESSLVAKDSYESLEVKNLSFAYPDTVLKVLHNINFSLPSKGLVLIQGISGSGKSTLLKILSGNLKNAEGQVSVNGKDEQWSRVWLEDNTSYMNQFPFIFDDTLRYNVFLSHEKQEQDYPAYLDRIIDKKDDGWQTLLSHNGKQLSGGEKQLMTLARMMLHPKAVAILDEPTASLDSNTTGIIIEEIKKMARDKLVILASHETRFEAMADVVINLNWGEQMLTS